MIKAKIKYKQTKLKATTVNLKMQFYNIKTRKDSK